MTSTSDGNKRGEGKPATFDFLGFTHCCGKSQQGTFRLLRLTIAKRLRAKLKQIKLELRRLRERRRIASVGRWLSSGGPRTLSVLRRAG